MQRWLTVSLFSVCLAFECARSVAAEPLTVESDFEGASVRDVEIDAATRSISFMPGGDPVRGWPCWWYFRVNGITPGETITLRLRGSTATVPKPGAPPQKPLASSWAMPAQATFSNDGETWLHTEQGKRQDEWMIYTLKPESASVFVAWGPPYTPSTAAKFVRAMSEKSPHAKATELCRSRGDRSVPMLHVQEGERRKEQRFGVWVQARQHAWESGSSWVAQGFAEWLLSDAAEAAWLRQHAEIFLVPIMDVDNTATGNGGKDAQPQDHNRDWSAQPHWNEIIAAQRMVSGLIEEGRMDIFLDLHNPAPDDPTFFYILSPELLKEPMIGLRDRFIQLAYARISKIKPLIPMSNKPKVTGANYHPLWRQISANWVSMNGNPHTVSLCLETIWNYPNSTTEGYRAVGSNLAAAVREYLAERSEKPRPKPPNLLIGYNEHRTNLPGGRQANVSTNRAMLVNADGSERRALAEELINQPDAWTQFAGWSPDGKIAVIGRGWESLENAKWEEEHKTFRFTPEGWLYDSYLVDVATGKAQNVTAVERVSFYNSGLFFWPNDSKKLGFTALINGNSKPFRMDRDGRNKVDLTKNSNGFAYGFSSSRDGSRISYHENYQVYLADADGSHRVQVQTGHPFNFAPAWSPDGQWVLFVSGEHYNCHPHIVRADGTGLKKLADRAGYRGVTEFLDVPDFHGGSSDTPIWSVDGASVFYTAKVGNNVELFRATLAGVTEQLTKSADGTPHYHPKPLPDGHWIVYGSKRNGVRNLYLMRLSDHTEQRLTDLPVGHAAMHAYWQPAATPD